MVLPVRVRWGVRHRMPEHARRAQGLVGGTGIAASNSSRPRDLLAGIARLSRPRPSVSRRSGLLRRAAGGALRPLRYRPWAVDEAQSGNACETTEAKSDPGRCPRGGAVAGAKGIDGVAAVPAGRSGGPGDPGDQHHPPCLSRHRCGPECVDPGAGIAPEQLLRRVRRRATVRRADVGPIWAAAAGSGRAGHAHSGQCDLRSRHHVAPAHRGPCGPGARRVRHLGPGAGHRKGLVRRR